MGAFDLDDKILFFICLEILKCSIQCSRQIFVKPVFVNKIGVLCGINIGSIFQILADKDQLRPGVLSIYHLAKLNSGNRIIAQRDIQKNDIIRAPHLRQRSHKLFSGKE